MADSATLESALASAELPENGVDKIAAYLALLQQWNKTYNLTAVRDPAEMVSRHILDSLAISAYLEGDEIADLGTGPGLPGIPLAIRYPARHFTLLDSNSKKTIFLNNVVRALNLDNVEIVRTRLEEYRPAHSFDTLTARALASTADILRWADHLCKPGGCFLLMKSQQFDQEIKNLDSNYHVENVVELNIPGLDARRRVAIIRKSRSLLDL